MRDARSKFPIISKVKYLLKKVGRNFGKFIPVIGIVLLLALNNQSSEAETGTPLKEKLLTTFDKFGDSFIIGDGVYWLTTLIFIITLWTGYKYWACKLKFVRRNKELLHKIVVTTIVLTVLIRHIKATSEIGKYVDVAIFLVLLYLVIVGVWFLAKTIDGIDLRSDLYCWGLRIIGGVVIVFGFILLMSSSLAMTFSNSELMIDNIWWIFSVCLILLGFFMQYRSFRRHPAIMVW